MADIDNKNIKNAKDVADNIDLSKNASKAIASYWEIISNKLGISSDKSSEIAKLAKDHSNSQEKFNLLKAKENDLVEKIGKQSNKEELNIKELIKHKQELLKNTQSNIEFDKKSHEEGKLSEIDHEKLIKDIQKEMDIKKEIEILQLSTKESLTQQIIDTKILSKSQKDISDRLQNQLKSVKKQDELQKSIIGHVSNISGSFGEVGKSLEALGIIIEGVIANPLTIILVLLGMAVKLFVDLDAAGGELSKTTHLLQSQTVDLKKQIQDITVEYSKYGITASDVAKTQAGILESTNDNNFATLKTAASVALMDKRLGVSAESSTDVLSIFRGMSGMSSDAALNLSAQTIQMAKLAHVAPGKIFEDIAKSSGKALVYMKGDATALVKAAIEARRFGSSLDAVASSADSLLDFETSINSEMNLSQMLGKNINLQKMRELAFNKDLGGLAKAQSEFLREQGGLQNMNVFAQKAAGQALGLTLEQMTKINDQNAIQDDFAKEMAEAKTKDPVHYAEMDKFQKDQIQYEKQKADLGKKSKLSGYESLKQLAEQEKTQTQLADMQAKFNGLVAKLGAALLPIVSKIILPLLQKITDGITSWTGSTEDFSKALDDNISKYKWLLKLIYEISIGVFKISSLVVYFVLLGKILSRIGVFGEEFTETILKWVESIKNVFSWFSKIFKFIPIIGKFGAAFLEAIPGLGEIIIAIQTIWSVISNVIKNWDTLKQQLMSGDIAGLFKTIGKIIFDTLTDVLFSPFVSLLNWVGSFFGVKLGDISLSAVKGLSKLIYVYAIEPIIDIGQAFIDMFKNIYNAFKSGIWSGIGALILEPFKFIAKALYDWFISPFVNVLDWIGSFFGAHLKDFILDGLKSAGNLAYDILIQPFMDVWNWLKKTFFGNSPSELGLLIVNGIGAIGGLLLDVLLSPYKMAWTLITDLFSFNNIGKTIMETFEKIAPMIFGALISPFQDIIKYIPDNLLPKGVKNIFTNIPDKTSKPEDFQSTNTQEQSKQSVKVDSTNTDLNDVLSKLTAAINILMNNGITVELDGQKVTKAITSRVATQNV